MELDEVTALLAEVHARRVPPDLPEELNPFDFTTASDAELDRVEGVLGVRLPPLYRAFLPRVGGQFLFLDVLPAVARDSRSDDLLTENQGPSSIPDFVAIAPVGTGDWWGFPVVDGTCDDRVFFWDHETGDLELVAADVLEFLASYGLTPHR